MLKKTGFTLLELIMVIIILGILAAVAIPKYADLQSQAEVSAERGVVGGVRAGISIYYANQCATASCAYPASLDGLTAPQACDASNPCFTTVLSQGGIISDWTKATAASYTGPTGATYNYTSGTGEFK